MAVLTKTETHRRPVPPWLCRCCSGYCYGALIVITAVVALNGNPVVCLTSTTVLRIAVFTLGAAVDARTGTTVALQIAVFGCGTAIVALLGTVVVALVDFTVVALGCTAVFLVGTTVVSLAYTVVALVGTAVYALILFSLPF